MPSPAAHVSQSFVGFGLVFPEEPDWLEGEVQGGPEVASLVSVGVAGRASVTRKMAKPGGSVERGESHAPRPVGSKTVRSIDGVVPPRAECRGLAREGTLIPAGHCFSIGQITLQVLWVLRGVSFRSGSAVVGTLMEWGLGRELFSASPHATTVRWWLLRLGYYQVHREKEQANDWVWFIDHSNQIGKEKFLAVLGIRLSQLPSAGQALRLCDMQVIDLQPVTISDKQVVYQQLQANVAKTGVPRAILHDWGGDLAGGTALFREAHPDTLELYDVAHKAACLLKAILQHDERFRQFGAQVGRTKCQLQQTELSFLVPPKPREKARYMNLESLIHWGRQTLTIVDAPPESVLKHATAARLDEKLGWLRDYRDALDEWSEVQEVIRITIELVRREGLCHDTEPRLSQRLSPMSLGATAAGLRTQLLAFVHDQASKARPDERLPGSSEILESCFGKYKSLERDQVHGGLTSLLLAFGACVSKITTETVHAALTQCKTKDVIEWTREKLGATHGSKRRIAYQEILPFGATKPVRTLQPAAA
jgi:hypothetical protein